MKAWTLDIVIKHFDHFLGDVDFGHLPAKQSEEYRQLVLKMANDVMFIKGRYSHITEWILEMFDVEAVNLLIHDLKAISSLTEDERCRLSFYLDVKEVCYPLFRGQKVDWTAWPWQMKSNSNSLDHQELFDLITSGDRPCLSAAILYDLVEQIWMDETFYSSVARQEVSDLFGNNVQDLWKHPEPGEEGQRKLAAAVNECANRIWFVENHMWVGRQLGFDHLTQSVYDAFDTFIDTTYRHSQVDFARELAAWIGQNWTMGNRQPDRAQLDALYAQMKQLMEKHEVSSPDLDFSWNILILDVLGVSLFRN